MTKDFKIGRPAGICAKSGKDIAPGEEFMALARMVGEEILREDYSLAAWEQIDTEALSADRDVLGIWRTRRPQPEEKKKLLIDDNLILQFFERLTGTDDPSRLNFRYVLCLILMRKRLLAYEGMNRREDGTEVWRMRRRGSDTIYEVIDPQLDEDKITAVSQQLGDVMQRDFSDEPPEDDETDETPGDVATDQDEGDTSEDDNTNGETVA
ncbi:MAG: hypothetical protein GVY16_03280 [Planctomycetes bacterium]|jgi:hypothetical protein|nr:hypothetical protein [Planctomycetota bacterium]